MAEERFRGARIIKVCYRFVSAGIGVGIKLPKRWKCRDNRRFLKQTGLDFDSSRLRCVAQLSADRIPELGTTTMKMKAALPDRISIVSSRDDIMFAPRNADNIIEMI